MRHLPVHLSIHPPIYRLVNGQESTPFNKTIQNIITNLLTSYISKLIVRHTVNEVRPLTLCKQWLLPPLLLLLFSKLLKILNSNTENPYLIWDNRTRAELIQYLETQQQSMIRAVSFINIDVLLIMCAKWYWSIVLSVRTAIILVVSQNSTFYPEL